MIAFASFLFLLCILSGDVSCSSGDSRSKAATDPVDANTVEATAAVPKVLHTLQHNCSDPHNGSVDHCPTGAACSDLPADCLQCNFNCSCVYGKKVNVTCRPKPTVFCQQDGGVADTVREMVCQYCYQTPSWQHTCSSNAQCQSADTPRPQYSANCTVPSDVLCLGRRNFLKKRDCNWTSGYHWATALTLSLTLGGFGADRFYLGHWQEGIGKLFSFGGLGVWTIMDVILIAIRYLGPADGSLYI